MLRVAQECFSGRLQREHARLSFDAKLELEAANPGKTRTHDETSERWMLRLSQTMAQFVVGAALLGGVAEKRMRNPFPSWYCLRHRPRQC